MRKSGKATPKEDLKDWPNKKLGDESIKQIRTDFGGKEAVKLLARKAMKYGIPPGLAINAAEFALAESRKQCKGSRKRVQSKIDVLVERIESLESILEDVVKTSELVCDHCNGVGECPTCMGQKKCPDCGGNGKCDKCCGEGTI